MRDSVDPASRPELLRDNFWNFTDHQSVDELVQSMHCPSPPCDSLSNEWALLLERDEGIESEASRRKKDLMASLRRRQDDKKQKSAFYSICEPIEFHS